jgi:hypothetical protein
VRAALCGLLALCALACGRSGAQNPPFVPPQASRLVVAPSELVWLGSHEPTRTDAANATALPSAVTLGSRAGGRSVLYLEFAGVERVKSRELLASYLLLTPDAGQMSSQPVSLELSRASALEPGSRDFSERPRSRSPRLDVQVRPNAPVLRLDVTELLSSDLERGRTLRLMLRAEARELEGVRIATGASGGRAPRLELYWLR